MCALCILMHWVSGIIFVTDAFAPSYHSMAEVVKKGLFRFFRLSLGSTPRERLCLLGVDILCMGYAVASFCLAADYCGEGPTFKGLDCAGPNSALFSGGHSATAWCAACAALLAHVALAAAAEALRARAGRYSFEEGGAGRRRTCEDVELKSYTEASK